MKRSGTYEWLFQRCSTLLIIAYAVVYISLITSLPVLDYQAWVGLHSVSWFKIYTSFTFVIVVTNSILAGWQIGTDYTQKVPVAGFSQVFHSFYSLVSLAILIFGLYTLWLV